MRYAAPADVAGISLSIGYLAVTDGAVEVPDNAPQGDLAGLAAYGFAPSAPEPSPAPAGKKSDPAPAEEPATN